ncbi:MAG: SDR family oxidoreductase [Thermoanaerobaculia bacterium]
MTGAAGGMGACFAAELARSGAAVVAGDTNAAGLRRLAARGRELDGELAVAKVDVTDEASVADFTAEAVRRLGGVDALVNCAGIARDGELVRPEEGELKRLPLPQWRKVLEVNLTGQYLITREVVAHMLEAGHPGVVVNISSLARAGNPGQSNYAASKAGLDACTRTWALELAPHGIRVGGVAPGVTDTAFLEGFGDDARERLRAQVPLGRLGRPEEIWQAVRFVIECDFFTGRTVEVDGGAAMGHAEGPGRVPS